VHSGSSSGSGPCISARKNFQAASGALIQWGKVPWPLWAFAALTVAGATVIEVEVHGNVASRVIFPFVMFSYLFFLLKGSRWLWIATLLVSILGLAVDLVSGFPVWRSIFQELIGPALLLLPVTRRYFASEPEAETEGVGFEPTGRP
jgi:hypothetical protein